MSYSVDEKKFFHIFFLLVVQSKELCCADQVRLVRGCTGFYENLRDALGLIDINLPPDISVEVLVLQNSESDLAYSSLLYITLTFYVVIFHLLHVAPQNYSVYFRNTFFHNHSQKKYFKHQLPIILVSTIRLVP